MVQARFVALSVVMCVLLPRAASAQADTASGLTGVARDASGGVLPGVTVEAASPALIEKVKVGITDGDGRYNIIDLRPGTYSVTFTLPSFSVFRRDGIVLEAGFVAQVNADMRLGTLEETITVTGDAPLVDTQTARSQSVVTSDLLNVLPSSVKNLTSIVALTPGYRGSEGFDITGGYQGQVGRAFHGKAGGTKVNFDGMSIQHSYGSQGYNQNQETVQETVLSTSGITAETNADGVQINLVPKEGSNIYSGGVTGLYTSKGLQSDNLSAELLERGLLSVTSVNYVFEVGATLGGPIMQDKMWFFGSYRQWGNERGAAGKFYNATQGTNFYTPDFNRPAFGHEWMESKAIRWTWLASPRNKINVFADHQRDCHCPANTGSGSVDAPEAFFSYQLTPAGLYQISYTSPVTSRLLVEAGAGVVHGSWPQYMQPEVAPGTISMLEQTTNVRFNSTAFNRFEQHVPRMTQRGSLSYVTGSHAFKTGLHLEEGWVNLGTEVTDNVNYILRNGIPEALTQWATPFYDRARVLDLGFFVQDQWKMDRLTVNYGVRYEYFYGWVPAITQPASGDYSGIKGLRTIGGTTNGWVPERRFDEVKGIPQWHDLNPRVGGAYDLFGNGRTAIKASLGRFVAKTGVAVTQANNPVATSINTVNRNWNDANGNGIPDCDLGNRGANGECGAMANQNFGGSRPSTQYADDVLAGWGNRGYNWDFNTELEHQLTRGVSLSAGYYRNWYGNFQAADNTRLGPGDYDTYCITAPIDSRLPGGGGYQVCGLADVKPEKFGQVNTVISQSSNFGKQKQINDFFNISINTRLGEDITLGAGFDTGRQLFDRCFIVDSPGELVNCRYTVPPEGNHQFKMHWGYVFPGDVIVSGIYQNISQPESTSVFGNGFEGILADYRASNAEIAPSLGRNLAECGTRAVCTASATVPLIVPGTVYGDRMQRLDLRVGKRFRVTDRVAVQGNFNVFNLFNGAAVALLNNTYGSNWQLPSRTQDGRMVQFSATLNY